MELVDQFVRPFSFAVHHNTIAASLKCLFLVSQFLLAVICTYQRQRIDICLNRLASNMTLRNEQKNGLGACGIILRKAMIKSSSSYKMFAGMSLLNYFQNKSVPIPSPFVCIIQRFSSFSLQRCFCAKLDSETMMRFFNYPPFCIKRKSICQAGF